VVLAAIGNAHRFRKASELLRLAGFDLSAHRSGTKSATAVPVISKEGKSGAFGMRCIKQHWWQQSFN